MVSLRHHGGDLAGNNLILIKAHIPLSLKPPVQRESRPCSLETREYVIFDKELPAYV